MAVSLSCGHPEARISADSRAAARIAGDYECRLAGGTIRNDTYPSTPMRADTVPIIAQTVQPIPRHAWIRLSVGVVVALRPDSISLSLAAAARVPILDLLLEITLLAADTFIRNHSTCCRHFLVFIGAYDSYSHA